MREDHYTKHKGCPADLKNFQFHHMFSYRYKDTLPMLLSGIVLASGITRLISCSSTKMDIRHPAR